MKLNKDLNQGITEFLHNYIREHSLSQSTLAEQLGYKSVTSVVRLIKGRVAYVAVEDCLRRFADMPMTPAEQEEYNRLTGTDISLFKHYQWLSILNSKQIDPMDDIRLEPNNITLRQHFETAQNLEIRIFGCITPKIIGTLSELMDKGAQIEHLIRIDDQGRTLTDILEVILPLFYCREYHASLYDSGKTERIAGLTNSDCILCSYTDAYGNRFAEMISLISTESAVIMRLDPNTDIDSMYTLLRKDKKTNSFSSDRRNDYGTNLVDYLRYCYQLEKDVPIRKIKPDIGLESIPADILRAAVKTDLMANDPRIAVIVPVMYDILQKRWRSTLLNTQNRQAVLKRSSMEAFFKTGTLSDHPFLLRPFTVEERRQILDSLVRMQTSNSNNYIYFLKDDNLLVDRETALYGRTGLLMVRPYTNYTLGGSHSEILLCRKHLMDSFSAFFDEALIEKSTLSREESEQVLRSFYALLQN